MVLDMLTLATNVINIRYMSEDTKNFDQMPIQQTSDAQDASPKPRWQKPWFLHDLGEIERTAQELGIDLQSLVAAFAKGALAELSDADWVNMKNCDSHDPSWTIEEVREHLKVKRDFGRIEQGILAGHSLPAPVVLYRDNEPPYLISGNSRLLGCRALGLRPTVFAVNL